MKTDYDKETPKPGKGLPITGFIITGVWAALVAVYVFNTWPAVWELHPNELGDFAAGAAAPLAFLWLVLGFFQQGEELRYSGKALWLQGKELQASVEQQRELVQASRDQLKFEGERLAAEREEIERKARPVLKLMSGGDRPNDAGTRFYLFRIMNSGNPCTDVAVYVGSHRVGGDTLLPAGATTSFELALPHDEDLGHLLITVTYLDARTLPGRATFTVSGRPGDFNIEAGHEGASPLILG